MYNNVVCSIFVYRFILLAMVLSVFRPKFLAPPMVSSNSLRIGKTDDDGRKDIRISFIYYFNKRSKSRATKDIAKAKFKAPIYSD